MSGLMATNSRKAVVMIVLALAVVVPLSLFIIGSNCASKSVEASAEATEMMDRLADGPGTLVYADLKSMRVDPDLKPVYDAMERDVEFWLGPMSMDFGEIDRIGVGGSVAVITGPFDLDQLRCRLETGGFQKTEYREVEIWLKDSEVINCDGGGLFPCASSNLKDNPCIHPQREAEEERPPYSGQIQAVALMSTRRLTSRGYETIISGAETSVKECIGVIKYGDASMYDDSYIRLVANQLPMGPVIKCQKGKLLDDYRYDGLEISGVSIGKRDVSTLRLEGVCKFADSESARAATNAIRADLQNGSTPTWRNVEVIQDGSIVKVSAEADTAPLQVIDLAPPSIVGSLAYSVTVGAAVITWTTDEPATSEVEYGEDQIYDYTSPVDESLLTSHVVILTGLDLDTEYHYRVASSDASGLIGVSPDLTFRTLKDFPGSYDVIDDNGQPALRIQMAATIFVDVGLVDPEGMLVDLQSVDPGATEVVLHMAGPYVIPGGGIYTLIANDMRGNQIVLSTFDFSGPEPSVENLSFDWKYVGYSGGYNLYGISFNLKNDGDLPLYVDRAQISIGSLMFDTDISVVILPDEKRTLDDSMYVTNIPAGSKRFVLQLRDGTGTIYLTYSTTVIPS